MRIWLRYLPPILLYLVSVGCSSVQPTVRVTQITPLACLVRCEAYPTAPPVSDERLDAWLSWGDDVTADYETCRRMHEDCVKGLSSEGPP